jgi:hypothetical protein
LGVPFKIESISIGGAGLFGPLILQEDELIQILFDSIDVDAEVICVVDRTLATDRVAVRFRDLEPSTRELIERLVERSVEDDEERLVVEG